MSPASEVAWSEAWRKSFQCKPYDGDRTDAIRFMREFTECAVLIEADDDYTAKVFSSLYVSLFGLSAYLNWCSGEIAESPKPTVRVQTRDFYRLNNRRVIFFTG